MLNRIVFFLLFILLPFFAQAYQGDYILEEQYKKLLSQAEAGNTDAQHDIGEMLEKGRGVSKDANKAFQWYLKAAEQGHTKAAYRVGLSFLKGNGVKKNPDEALKWMELASERGYERANFYMGVMYEKGEGVDRNLTRALSYYKKSLTGGYSPAKERYEDVQNAIRDEERRRTRRAEAAARKRLDTNKDNDPKPQRVSIKSNLTTEELLLKGNWKKKNRPAEFLPSKLAECKKTGVSIECVSSKLKRNIGMADISYTTKAVLYSIKDDGSFKISYRNNVTDIKVTDPEYKKSGAKVPVKKGWQDAEHILECKIESPELMNCTKDKIRSVTFNRK